MIKRKEEKGMYIPEFWCGFVAGMVFTIVGIIFFAAWYSKKQNEKEED